MRTLLATASALALVAACRGDAATPPADEPFELSLAVKQVHPALTYELPDGPAIACGVDITATAVGTGEASWEGATFYWFAGVTRANPIDSMRVNGNSVRASWEHPTISGDGIAHEAAWDFAGRAPFAAEMHFRYRLAGEPAARTSSLRFTCGPDVPSGGAERPQIAITEVIGGESGEVEAGDSVTVGFAASSVFGLWITGAVVEEAFQFQLGYAERMAATAAHHILVVVPTGGTLGATIDLDAYAVDGMLQVTRARIPTELRLVDHTPPTIVSAAPVATQYAVGERLNITVAGKDNNELRWLIYEFGAPLSLVDSVRAAADVPATTWNIPLTVRPEWIGPTTLSVRLRDAAGLASEPLPLTPGGVTFVPAAGFRER